MAYNSNIKTTGSSSVPHFNKNHMEGDMYMLEKAGQEIMNRQKKKSKKPQLSKRSTLGASLSKKDATFTVHDYTKRLIIK